jgi:hypothetical protein
MMIRYINSTGEFEAYIPGFHTEIDYEILGARGYLVFEDDSVTVTIEGRGWMGRQDQPPGGYLYAGKDQKRTSTAVLGVTGRIYQRVWDREEPLPAGCSVVITNGCSGAEIAARIDEGSGHFSGAFVDLSNESPVRAGDTLVVTVRGLDGRVIGEPVTYIVTSKDIGRMYAAFDAEVSGAMPSVTALHQNFPNPFNPFTRIRYQIAKPGRVSLRIYNVAGQLVRTLVDRTKRPGYYEEVWKGDNDGGRTVASGVYFYRLETPGYSRSLKMVILR